MPSTSDPRPIRVFYSYSQQDEELRRELEKHLKLLVRMKLIEDWNERQIEAGDEWDAEIRRRLAEADLILLLVSPDFMDSNYIWEKELAPALDRHREGTARVIPIFARPTELRGLEFMKLQGLPSYDEPVSTAVNRDEAWLKVARGIRKVVETMQAQKRSGTPREVVASTAVAGLPPQGTSTRPSTGSLRKLIASVLSEDEFDAFCSDYFPDVRRRFASGIQHVAKVTLLFENADRAEILQRLREEQPTKVKAHESLLRWE
jgi:hypothetical protein